MASDEKILFLNRFVASFLSSWAAIKYEDTNYKLDGKWFPVEDAWFLANEAWDKIQEI